MTDTSRGPGLRNQAEARTGLRLAGWVVLGVGLALTVTAMASFFETASDMAAMSMTPQGPDNFWMAFVGLPMMALGGALLKFGYLGTGARYVAGEVADPLRDTLAYVTQPPAAVARTCPACHQVADADARFCEACGARLV